MKRIIAFVLLGLLIYAGAFVIYYAAVDLEINSAAPAYLDNVNPGNFHTGLVVEGEIYQVMDEIKTKTVQPRLFGIPFGKAITQHYYVLPLYSSQMFTLIVVSEEEDVEALEQMIVREPHEREPNDPVLKITGIAEELPLIGVLSDLKTYLLGHPELIGYDDPDVIFARPLEPAADNHTVPYAIYVKHPTGKDYVSLIVGIAMCVVGVALAVLLIIRIKSEKEGY